jgi:hypothetical protein
MDSIIKTPNGYYGVDSNCKKIWKYNNTNGFICISDFTIQSFLNEIIDQEELNNYFKGVTNIKTHYNAFKGDVIFTFYTLEGIYSICYNEILQK